eukprot:3304374-Rhodomonas_salina.2
MTHRGACFSRIALPVPTDAIAGGRPGRTQLSLLGEAEGPRVTLAAYVLRRCRWHEPVGAYALLDASRAGQPQRGRVGRAKLAHVAAVCCLVRVGWAGHAFASSGLVATQALAVLDCHSCRVHYSEGMLRAGQRIVLVGRAVMVLLAGGTQPVPLVVPDITDTARRTAGPWQRRRPLRAGHPCAPGGAMVVGRAHAAHLELWAPVASLTGALCCPLHSWQSTAFSTGEIENAKASSLANPMSRNASATRGSLGCPGKSWSYHSLVCSAPCKRTSTTTFGLACGSKPDAHTQRPASSVISPSRHGMHTPGFICSASDAWKDVAAGQGAHSPSPLSTSSPWHMHASLA